MAADPHDATTDLLVAYYEGANGEHDDWEDYRAAMVADQRLVLSFHPERAYGIPNEDGCSALSSDSSTSWERSSTRTSSSLLLARTASSSMIMQ